MEDAARTVPVETLLRHRGWVRALAWSLVRDAHLVDEVEQETWLRALRSPPREEAAARGWLATVVRNVVRNRFRSQSRRTAHEEAAPPRTASPSASDVVARADAQQVVVRAVMALDEPYRTTLLLRFFDDLPPRDVAARMGVPVETVRTRTRRGLARLRDALAGERGGRRGALALLAPLLVERAAPVGTATASTASMVATTGALVMAGTTTKWIAAAAVVLVAVGGGWLAAGDPAGPDDAREGAALDATDVAARGGDSGASRERVRRDVPGVAPPRTSPSSSPGSVERTTTTVRVLLPDGSPAHGMRAVDVPGPGGSRVEAVQEDGRLVISGTGHHQLLLRVPGWPPHGALVRLGEGDVEVRLPAGHAVQGIVRVNGSAPASPIELRLGLPSTDAPTPRTGGPGLDPVLHTGQGGAFRFDGLPDAGRGRLVIEARGHDFVGGDGPFLDVEIPSRGLVLDLVPRPRVSGRVVGADGAPVANARLTLRWTSADGSGSQRRDAQDDGTFDVALPAPGITEAAITVSDPSGVATASVEVPTSGSAPGGDVGTVVLPPVRDVRVQVVDASGKPIPKAIALVGRVASRVGADGIATVRVAGARARVGVGALGFLSAERELTPGLAEPVRVELAPATLVDLRVHPPDHGVPGLAVRVRVRGAEVFEGLRGAYPAGVDRVAGASSPGSWDARALPGGAVVTTGWFPPDGETGRVTLNGVRRDVEMDVALIDAVGTVHDRITVRPGSGADAPHLLRVRTDHHTVRGVVRDPDGNPVRGARVELAASGEPESPVANGPGVWTRTDEDGRFYLMRVAAAEVDVLVTVDDRRFVPWARGGTAVADDVELDVRLEAGVAVRLTLRDRAGEPVTPEFGFADIELPFDGGAFLWPLEPEPDAAPGIFRIAGLPRDGGAVTLSIRVEEEHGSAIHRVTIDPAEGDREIVLGEPAFRDRAESGD